MESNLVNQSYFKFIYLANAYSFPEHVYTNKTESTILTGRHPIKNEKKLLFTRRLILFHGTPFFQQPDFQRRKKDYVTPPLLEIQSNKRHNKYSVLTKWHSYIKLFFCK